MDIIGQNPPEAQMRINLAELDDITCDRCDDRRFEPVVLLKRLSALQSPTGKATVIPLDGNVLPEPIFACLSCGHINEEFLPIPLRATRKTARPDPKQTSTLELIK